MGYCRQWQCSRKSWGYNWVYIHNMTVLEGCWLRKHIVMEFTWNTCQLKCIYLFFVFGGGWFLDMWADKQRGSCLFILIAFFFLSLFLSNTDVYLQCKAGKVWFPTKYIINAISKKPLHMENRPWCSNLAHYRALATTLSCLCLDFQTNSCRIHK